MAVSNQASAPRPRLPRAASNGERARIGLQIVFSRNRRPESSRQSERFVVRAKPGAVRQAALEQRKRRDPGERAEITREMRLVVVTARDGHIGQCCPAVLQRPRRSSKSQHPSECLRCQAELVPELHRQVPLAPADVVANVGDSGAAVGRNEPVPRPNDGRRGLTRRGHPRANLPIEYVERASQVVASWSRDTSVSAEGPKTSSSSSVRFVKSASGRS